MITQSINLNLIPGGVLPRFNVSQYDKGSRVLQFNLFSGSFPFEVPDGSTVTIQGTKKDMTGFQYPCTYQGSLVMSDLYDQMTVLAGEVTTELVITDTNLNILGTCNFIIDVEQAALSKDIPISETELPLLQEAVRAANEAKASAEAAEDDANEAKASAEAAEDDAKDAEAWANGTRSGVPVEPSDPTYQKNAKYYVDNCIGMITDAQWSEIQTILST
jgi:hypothetical protein